MPSDATSVLILIAATTAACAVFAAVPGNPDLDRLLKGAFVTAAAASAALVCSVHYRSRRGFDPFLILLAVCLIISNIWFEYNLLQGIAGCAAVVSGVTFALCIAWQERLGKWAVPVLCLPGVCIGIVAVIQQISGSGSPELRATTFLGNPDATAVITLFSALGLGATARLRLLADHNRLVIAGAIVAVAGTCATLCKTSVIALIAGTGIIMALPLLHRLKWQHWFFILGTVALLPIILVATLGSTHPVFVLLGLEGRALIWDAALVLLKQHWLMGLGSGSWQPALAGECALLVRSGHGAPCMILPNSVYNLPLQIALESGMVPVLLLMLILARACANALRQTNQRAPAGVALLGLFVAGLALPVLQTASSSVFWWIAVGFCLIDQNRDGVHAQWLQRGVLAVCAVVLILQSVGSVAGIWYMVQSRRFANAGNTASAADAAQRASRFLHNEASVWFWRSRQERLAGCSVDAIRSVDRALGTRVSYPALLFKGNLIDDQNNSALSLRYWLELGGDYPWLAKPIQRVMMIHIQAGDVLAVSGDCRRARAFTIRSNEQKEIIYRCLEICGELK